MTTTDNTNTEAFAPNEGDLKIWWIPQVPGVAFEVNVPDLATARLLCDVLADYDRFQFEHQIKPDYCNVGGINVYEAGEWFDVDVDDGEE